MSCKVLGVNIAVDVGEDWRDETEFVGVAWLVSVLYSVQVMGGEGGGGGCTVPSPSPLLVPSSEESRNHDS